jgi:diguanylate cyclase (GGDEF)-like protein
MDMSEPTRILIVDDSEDDSLLISRELSREIPHAAFRRVDTEQGMLSALRDQEWDLVISDHSMPRFDSVRALKVLREARCDIPFIVYSGNYDHEKGIAAMTGGAEDYLYKSDPQRLPPVVRRELRNAQLRRAKDKAERAAHTMSLFDELTGLPNRSLLAQKIQSRAAAPGAGAVVCVDIDRFMRINDSFGFATGDALLKQVANRLQAVLGSSDVLARLSGDRFSCLLWTAADAAGARDQAERMLAVFSAPFQQNGQELFLTASVGCALLPEHSGDVDVLLHGAEHAMATAKKNGRNRIDIFDPKLTHGASTRLQLENSLHHAVEREELFLVYQPMYEVGSKRVGAAEALIRWRHERFGVVPPDQFIPLADETGHIIEIGDWVLRRACQQARAWQRPGCKPLAVSVNFSAAQFRDERIQERVRNALEESGLPPELLEMEITETVAMQDAEHAIATMRSLKQMGVRIAIDDFGTGYSSLSYLRRFPIDVLKIDRSFVMELPGDSDSLSIVRTVVALARALKIGVVAEGVETADQFRLLSDEGIERMQGYYFSRPLSVDAFTREFIALPDEADLEATLRSPVPVAHGGMALAASG